jgi:hypothetical protein
LAGFLLEMFANMHVTGSRDANGLQHLKPFRTALLMLSTVFLTSCVIYTDHQLSGATRIDKNNHWIELKGLQLARTDENKWYTSGGPPAADVDCFFFNAGLPTFKEPPRFEVLRLELVYNDRAPLKFSRLVDLEESEMKIWYSSTRYEIWVPSQPSGAADEIPTGRYRVKLHYRFGDQEYDAEWQCTYKTRTKIARWHMPRC